MTSLNNIVGIRIHQRLDELGKTQADLANDLDVSRQIVNKIIHGRKNVTLEEIKMIADILGMSLDDLVKEPAKENEEDPIIAFMGEVDTEEARKGLKKAKTVMDMILFHRDINMAHQDLFDS